jgi:hypothetical protein
LPIDREPHGLEHDAHALGQPLDVCNKAPTLMLNKGRLSIGATKLAVR